MIATGFVPEWDRANQRFSTPSRCPYPDCAAPVDATWTMEAVLAWCPTCNRPYEAVSFQPAPGVARMELNRRPDSAFCAQTGQELNGYSLLDWCEAGGEPGRSFCQSDSRGAVFGMPGTRWTLRLTEVWEARAVVGPGNDEDDEVTSVSVVRGALAAVTARGSITLLDIAKGVPLMPHPLEWQASRFEPPDPHWSVVEPPACRGTHMVVVAPHEAQFRDLAPFLFPQRGGTARSARSVAPTTGTRFLGPPLGIEQAEGPGFCLLEAREADEPGVLADASLRFFDPLGVELASCAVPDIARSPVFDRRLDVLVWVNRHGGVAMLEAAAIRDAARLPVAVQLPDPVLHLTLDLGPTLAVVAGGQTRSELWLADRRAGGNADVHQVHFDPLRTAPGRGWSWNSCGLSNVGEVVGLAVGRGPAHRANAAARLAALATDRLVLSLDRANLATAGRAPAMGREGGVAGSHEAPIITSAGVISRLEGSLCLDSQGIGWNDESFQVKAAVPGLYQGRQGMAVFGRQIFIGYGPGVKSYRIDLAEAP